MCAPLDNVVFDAEGFVIVEVFLDLPLDVFVLSASRVDIGEGFSDVISDLDCLGDGHTCVGLELSEGEVARVSWMAGVPLEPDGDGDTVYLIVEGSA